MEELCQLIAHGFQITRVGGGKGHTFPCARVGKRDAPRVEGKARKQGAFLVRVAVPLALEVAQKDTALVARIERVAHDEYAQMPQVGAYLVGSSRAGAGFKPAVGAAAAQIAEIRFGRLADALVCHGAVAGIGIGEQGGGLMQLAPLRPSVHKAVVDLLYLSLFKLHGKGAVGIGIARVDNGSARVLVYAVHGKELAEFLFYGKVKAACPLVIPVGCNEQAGAFAYHHDIFIIIQLCIISNSFHTASILERKRDSKYHGIRNL